MEKILNHASAEYRKWYSHNVETDTQRWDMHERWNNELDPWYYLDIFLSNENTDLPQSCFLYPALQQWYFFVLL